MDCKTARLLLTFAAPPARELGPEEAGDLEGHLDHCPDCHGLAAAERQFDERLAKAMNQVEVPAGLREQILARMEAEHGDWHRRRFARVMRWAVAAAAALLLGWAGWRWAGSHPRPSLDLEKVAEAVNSDPMGDRRAHAEAALKRLGFDAPLPPQFNYNLLIAPPARAELPGVPGQQAAMLVFARGGRSATVYLVPAGQLRDDTPREFAGGTYKVWVERPEDEPYAFLVVHDGDDLNWLWSPKPPAA